MICLPRLRVHSGTSELFQAGTSAARDLILYGSFPWPCGYLPSVSHYGGWSTGSLAEGEPVESNERYYRRRAVEERMAARRAMTDTARAWHAKLAEDFAERASAACTGVSVCSQSAVAT
jgi:hypothetical protein